MPPTQSRQSTESKVSASGTVLQLHERSTRNWLLVLGNIYDLSTEQLYFDSFKLATDDELWRKSCLISIAGSILVAHYACMVRIDSCYAQPGPHR